jgi:small GTP-binding protein
MPEKAERLKNKLTELKTEYSKTKYNKATDKHLGILRAKIAKVKQDIIVASKKARGQGFFVRKSGDATIALIGFPNAGKSSLINMLANTRSRTADYAFTTLTVVPGTMVYRDAHIQIFDLPGLLLGAHEGKGGGSEVVSAAKSADLIVFVISVEDVKTLDVLMSELSYFDIKINKEVPNIQVMKAKKNIGVKIEVNKSQLPANAIETILNSFGIYNAEVRLWDDVSEDELISVLSNKAKYVRAIVALNKIDLASDYAEIAEDIKKRYAISVIPISITEEKNIEELKERVYGNLGLMRVYLKPELKKEAGESITIPRGSNVREVARRLHTKLVNEIRCAYVSGSSVKFSNQRVGVEHVLKDGDTITFIK